MAGTHGQQQQALYRTHRVQRPQQPAKTGLNDIENVNAHTSITFTNRLMLKSSRCTKLPNKPPSIPGSKGRIIHRRRTGARPACAAPVPDSSYVNRGKLPGADVPPDYGENCILPNFSTPPQPSTKCLT